MNIRLLNSMDAESYRDIRLEALQNSPEAFASSYEEEKDQSIDYFRNKFQLEDSIAIGAFERGELVGIVTLLRESLYKLRHRANIVSMYVSSKNRGQGIGTVLMVEALKKAKEIEGLEQVYLTVVSTNEHAKKVYSSLGFEVIGTEIRALKLDDNQYYDEDQMVLFL
ncbi:GNAT family N-acetyltransferase [Bacillus sp. ISL-32]|nr:GNAT family N-acetyltransferase [Bacillus sp. ISL-32]